MCFFRTFILLCSGFIHIQDCAVIHGFEYVLQKYLNPLQKLTAELPNHAIEMQIEFQEALPTYTKSKPQRRLIRIINPRKKPVKRSGDSEPKVSETPKTTATPASQAPVTTSAPAPVNPGSTSSKVPVYMDDLKKALDDLENKLKSMTTTVGTVTGTTAKGGPWWNGGSVGGGNDGSVHNELQTPVRSIDNIIGILKKAIHIEHRDPKPSENLEWIQVKIPKTGK